MEKVLFGGSWRRCYLVDHGEGVIWWLTEKVLFNGSQRRCYLVAHREGEGLKWTRMSFRFVKCIGNIVPFRLNAITIINIKVPIFFTSIPFRKIFKIFFTIVAICQIFHFEHWKRCYLVDHREGVI